MKQWPFDLIVFTGIIRRVELKKTVTDKIRGESEAIFRFEFIRPSPPLKWKIEIASSSRRVLRHYRVNISELTF